jgi:hypothetical protein
MCLVRNAQCCDTNRLQWAQAGPRFHLQGTRGGAGGRSYSGPSKHDAPALCCNSQRPRKASHMPTTSVILLLQSQRFSDNLNTPVGLHAELYIEELFATVPAGSTTRSPRIAPCVHNGVSFQFYSYMAAYSLYSAGGASSSAACSRHPAACVVSD